jgi:hypothetical protein
MDAHIDVTGPARRRPLGPSTQRSRFGHPSRAPPSNVQLINRPNGHGTVETLRTGARGRCTDTADVATGHDGDLRIARVHLTQQATEPNPAEEKT